MSIKKKALVETGKTAGLFLIALAALYTILNILGPKLGLILLSVSILGYFFWLTYDYYINKFTVEEKFKL
jgi:hypothetical protein